VIWLILMAAEVMLWGSCWCGGQQVGVSVKLPSNAQWLSGFPLLSTLQQPALPGVMRSWRASYWWHCTKFPVLPSPLSQFQGATDLQLGWGWGVCLQLLLSMCMRSWLVCPYPSARRGAGVWEWCFQTAFGCLQVLLQAWWGFSRSLKGLEFVGESSFRLGIGLYWIAVG
jgi:hypothetical protein